MNPGKALELLVKQILLHMGFSEIASDGLYIFDGPSGQMIQGLADAHNADVLLEPHDSKRLSKKYTVYTYIPSLIKPENIYKKSI